MKKLAFYAKSKFIPNFAPEITNQQQICATSDLTTYELLFYRRFRWTVSRCSETCRKQTDIQTFLTRPCAERFFFENK